MKKTRSMLKSTVSALLIAIFAISLLTAIIPIKVEAAAAYQYVNYQSIKKVGSRFFKITNDKIYYSTNKNSGYKAAKFKGSIHANECYTNGNTIIAVENTGETSLRLSRYTISTGNYKLLKKLSRKSSSTYDWASAQWRIADIYGSNVYLTREDYFGGQQVKTYVYNLTTNTFKAVKSNCDIVSRSGNYFLAVNNMADTFSQRYTIYRTNSKGDIIAVKTLGNYVTDARFIDGYVYYAKYKESGPGTATIYKCYKDGTGNTKLATVNEDIKKLYKTYCICWDNSGEFKYYYSTKKKISV